MLRQITLLAAAFSTTACTSRIELPGSVLPPEQGATAVEGMGAPEPWRPVDASTGQIANIESLEQLAEDFPNSSSVRLRLLSAQFRAEDGQGAVESIRALSGMRYLLSTAAREQLAPFIRQHAPESEMYLDSAEAAEADEVFYFMNGGVCESEVATVIPEGIRLPEATMWDDSGQRVFATSIVSRGLFVRDEERAWREVPLGNAGSLAGIALDEPRGLIWIGSGVVDQTPDPETAFRGVIAIDRITLEERRRVPAPDGVSISDIAVGPDGTVYGSDPVGGGVYSASIADTAMQTFIAPGTFRSPQGIAVRPDNTALYISDYRYGLAQVMIRSRVAYRMRTAEPMLLDGVDGLWLHGNELIAVQNGVQPLRITAFELGQGIGIIAAQRTLEMANRDWTEPLGGAISADSLYYIGTGQWDIYGEGGALNEVASPRPAQIRRLQLVETAPE